MTVSPLVDGVHLLLDALAVDVAVGDQTAAGFNHAADLLLVGVHGGHEVLLLLDGSLGALQSGGHLSVSQDILLQGEDTGFNTDTNSLWDSNRLKVRLWPMMMLRKRVHPLESRTFCASHRGMSVANSTVPENTIRMELI